MTATRVRFALDARDRVLNGIPMIMSFDPHGLASFQVWTHEVDEG